jgi:hypothetical protein
MIGTHQASASGRDKGGREGIRVFGTGRVFLVIPTCCRGKRGFRRGRKKKKFYANFGCNFSHWA